MVSTSTSPSGINRSATIPLLFRRIALAVIFVGLCFLCGVAVFGAWFMTVGAARHGSIGWTYAYSAYLVDYSAGFIRRGAIGAVIAYLAHGQPRVLLISRLVFFNYAALMICVAALILLNARRKLATALLVFLMPSGIVMSGVMGGFFVWKEALFLIGLAVLGCGYNLAVRIRSRAIQRALGRTLIAALLIFSVFACLAHEGFIFLAAPAFAYLLIALIRISVRPTHPETRLSMWYLVAMFGLFLVLGGLFHGNPAQLSHMWQHFNPADRNMYSPGDYGDLGVIGHTLADQLNDTTHLATSGFTWWYLSPLALLFIYCTVVACLVGGKTRGWSLSYVVIAIFAAPMFVLAVDYGRWLMMIQMTFLITLLSLGRDTLASIRILPVRVSSLERRLDHFESFSDNLVSRHITIVTTALLLFTLTFRMPMLFVTDPLGSNPEGAFPAAVVYMVRYIRHLH